MSERLSPDFSSDELVGWDRASAAQKRNARWVVANLLQPMRDQFGPIRITAWIFDSPSRLGAHPTGGAFDVVPVRASIPVVHRWAGNALKGRYGELIDERNHIHVTRFGIGGRDELLVEPEEGRYVTVDSTVGFPGGSGTYGRPISIPGVAVSVAGGPWGRVAPWLLVAGLLFALGIVDPFKSRALTRHH